MVNLRTGLVVGWTASLALCFAACATAPMGTREIVFSPATIEGISPGMGRRQVIALLGLPREKIVSDSAVEVWSWRYREALSPSGTVTYVIDEDLPLESTATVFVEFDDKRVVRAWYR